ncbi:hypothetical protein TMatcc_005286 [Talaromyces marneffei ATCC 18224]|uniref:CENP-S associating centromere protein X-domain-containing protein n=1 Tax=Talaromyces marneffei (strain ATCC 18224 / CBS 334.59 / QM 7333) TaxID=441960 RepID=B6QBK2_TALMQ|nr:conserved hypothetical protein [Talaromyces marneffei ATCC 18224]
MDAAQAKRNRLPFKAPRRQSEANKTTSKTTTRKLSSTSTASASKSTSKTKPSSKTASTSNPQKRKAQSTVSDAENPRKRKAQPISIPSDSEDSAASARSKDSDNGDDRNSSRSSSPEPDYILAEIITNNKPRNIESDEPGIPPKLLTTILHHHFQNKKTKITKDANEVVAKYMNIFVREALARAAFERADAASKDGGGKYAGDGFLEVEDLEKLAPQMLLDF